MPTKDDKFLKQARDRWKLAESADEKQRERELSDLQFYAGDQWPVDLAKAREGQTIGSGSTQQIVPARPCIVVNKTLEPVRQILNQERQSELGIELIPADDWGEVTGPIDHTEIELREGLVRRIQRDSESADARTWAFSRATIAGRGYWIVMTRFVPGKSSDQEVYIERIYNQASVLLDPSHEQPDGSDANWGFYGTDMLFSAFKTEYPDAEVSECEDDDKWRALGDDAPGWFSGEGDKRSVRVMNYYYTESKSKEVYHLTDGSAAYDNELVEVAKGQRASIKNPQNLVLLDEDGSEQCHTQIKKSIKWAKINGCEILDQTDWPGHWLPIIKTVGEELQPYDKERRCQGVVRPMRESCKGNNYIISKFVERVGLTPIPPWMMAGGQDEGYEEEYNASNTRTLSRLHYNQKDKDNMQAPPPFRVDARSEVGDLAMGLQMFGEAIQSTSVMPETALGHTDPSVKSGKLARALIEQGTSGTSNYMDNLVRSLRHEARVVNDLLYPIYGRNGRLARMMNGQGEMSAVVIGQPFTVQGQGKQAKPVPANIPGWQPGQPLPPGVKYHGLTPDADFNVACKVSKTIETRRNQISQFLGELIGADPTQMQIIGDKLWKYLDVPDHEDIEKRYRVMLAPPIQQLIGGNEPLPPEAQQKIAMLEQQLAEIMPLADKNKSDLMKTEMQQQADSARTVAELESKEKIEKWKLEQQLEIEMAKLGSAEAMARAAQDMQMLHHHNEQQLARETRDAEAADAQMQQQKEIDAQQQMAAQEADQQAQQSEIEHGQALEQGDQGHQQALEQGAQQQQGALEQQAQAAALQPVSQETQ